MRVHSCPRCDLRFGDEPELTDHLDKDHGVERSTLDHRYRLTHGAHPHRRAPDPTHVVSVNPRDDRTR